MSDIVMNAEGPLPRVVSGVIFDMDDTLINSESAWDRASRQLWTQHGLEYGDRNFLGGTVGDIAHAFCEDFTGMGHLEVARELENLIRGYLRTQVSPMPGAARLVERLSATVPLAIASNSPSSIVRESVTALGWSSSFRAALGTNDVDRPKPYPDLYLAAAAKLEAKPERCVIFEDSPVGARAAQASGAFVVTVGESARGRGHAAVGSLRDQRVTNWQPEVAP